MYQYAYAGKQSTHDVHDTLDEEEKHAEHRADDIELDKAEGG